MDLVVVFFGGVLGTAIRAGIELAWPTQIWPAATFTINLSGSFALGILVGALFVRGPDNALRRRIRLGVGTGLLGGYTTYSTFIIEGDELAHVGIGLAILYLVGSVVLGVLVAVLGMVMSRRFFAGERPAVEVAAVEGATVEAPAVEVRSAAPPRRGTD